MKIRAAILSLALLATPVLAETQADRDAIASGMDSLIAAVQAGEFAKTFDHTPPKMMEQMSQAMGVSVDDMKAQATAAAEMVMGMVKIESFDYDMANARFGTTDAREYALIPTSSVMEAMGQKIEAKGDTLALQDGGTWYLLRVEDPEQINMLHAAYPDMAGVEITPGTMTPVQ